MKEKGKKVLALYGTWTTEDRAAGYCWKHKACVTVRQIKEKQCVRKGCKAFQKREHPYWERKERFKELRKQKKELGIPVWEKVEIRTDRNGELQIGRASCRERV